MFAQRGLIEIQATLTVRLVTSRFHPLRMSDNFSVYDSHDSIVFIYIFCNVFRNWMVVYVDCSSYILIMINIDARKLRVWSVQSTNLCNSHCTICHWHEKRLQLRVNGSDALGFCMYQGFCMQKMSTVRRRSGI